MTTLLEHLQVFGLREKEAKTYLACLELGESLASEISLKSGIPRTLVYDILEKLINLGLVSYKIKNNLKYFTTSDPQELLLMLREKQKHIIEALPLLHNLQKLKEPKRPKVFVHEGKEGMKTIMNDILLSGVTTFYGYGSTKSSYEIIPAFIEDWHKQRIKKKIFMKIIYNNTKKVKERIKKYPQSVLFAKYKFMPITVESPTATLIYADKVVIQSWANEPFAVIIENKQIAENQKRYFHQLWNIAKSP